MKVECRVPWIVPASRPPQKAPRVPSIHTCHKDKVSLKEEQPVALVRSGLFLVLPFVIFIAGDNEMAEAVTAEHPRLLFGLNVDAVANAALTGWRTVSGNENLKLRIAKRAVAHVPMTWRCVLTMSSVIHSGRRVPMRVGANGLDSPSPQAAPILSIDELRSVVFIIRCARVIAFLQRFVPERYLPPKEDRIPPSLLKRLIRELKKLTPKWKWISSARELPRSPAKLGDELFYAITALRMSRLEIWRAGYTDCVAVLDEAYSLLYAIGISMRERKHRSKGRRTG
jgi:hypothetical protein